MSPVWETTLELDEAGKLLERRIQVWRYPECIIFLGIKFEVYLDCFVREQEQHQDDPPSARTAVVLEFREVRLAALQVDLEECDPELGVNSDTTEFTNIDGVTLPHFLEHLKAWDPDD
jgi:hypothetical protein